MIGPSRPPPVAGPSRPIGPQRPPSTQVESDEDDYTPALPPSHTAARPALPPDPDEEDSDDDVGPRPPPAGFSTRTAEEDAVAEFQAREERRRLQAEEVRCLTSSAPV